MSELEILVKKIMKFADEEGAEMVIIGVATSEGLLRIESECTDNIRKLASDYLLDSMSSQEPPAEGSKGESQEISEDGRKMLR